MLLYFLSGSLKWLHGDRTVAAIYKHCTSSLQELIKDRHIFE
jgi:hypothetical protein